MLTSNKAALGALAMLVPVVALSGLVGIDAVRPVVTSPHTASGYTLRCWQDGQLILEEQHVSLPPVVDAASTRLQVLDSKQQPIVIAETRNATCMVKARPAERYRSVLP